jgi:hypothetical protein
MNLDEIVGEIIESHGSGIGSLVCAKIHSMSACNGEYSCELSNSGALRMMLKHADSRGDESSPLPRGAVVGQFGWRIWPVKEEILRYA